MWHDGGGGQLSTRARVAVGVMGRWCGPRQSPLWDKNATYLPCDPTVLHSPVPAPHSPQLGAHPHPLITGLLCPGAQTQGTHGPQHSREQVSHTGSQRGAMHTGLGAADPPACSRRCSRFLGGDGQGAPGTTAASRWPLLPGHAPSP